MTGLTGMRKACHPEVGPSHGFNAEGPKFNPTPVYVGFMVDTAAMGEVFVIVIRYSLQYHSAAATHNPNK